MKSPINIISRKRKNGEIYYQARYFYDMHLTKSISLPTAKNKAQAILLAGEKAEQVLKSSVLLDEMEQYSLFPIEGIKKILALPDDTPKTARETLIVLLGITCGLGVSEIINLKKDQITKNSMLIVENDESSRFVPIIGNVRNRIERMCSYYPISKFIIPNLKNIRKPCNPISIKRGLDSVKSLIGLNTVYKIVPSSLRKTFFYLLVLSNKKIDINILDYLCGFRKSSSALSAEEKTGVIDAINEIMMNVQNVPYSCKNFLDWSFPN
jgi:integrase